MPIDGEINVFEQEYHRDLDSDQSDVGEEEYHPSVLGGVERLSPESEPVERLSYGDRRMRLQKVAKMNAQVSFTPSFSRHTDRTDEKITTRGTWKPWTERWMPNWAWV